MWSLDFAWAYFIFFQLAFQVKRIKGQKRCYFLKTKLDYFNSLNA